MSVDEPNVLAPSRDLTLRVGSFEGPFDLLLHLCRTNEIDLAAFPVRVITDQYLAHLESMEFRDLEAAGTLPRVRVPLPNGGELRKLLFDKADLDTLIEHWKDGVQSQ